MNHEDIRNELLRLFQLQLDALDLSISIRWRASCLRLASFSPINSCCNQRCLRADSYPISRDVGVRGVEDSWHAYAVTEN